MMAIGTSLGGYYESPAHHQAGVEDVEDNVLDPETTPDIGTRDQNVKTPVDAPTTASTMPVRASQELTGALKSSEGTKVPPEKITNPGAPDSDLPDIDDVPHHDWVENLIGGIAKSAASGLTLPGDVSQGKARPDDVERAADLAMVATGSGGITAGKASENTLGSTFSSFINAIGHKIPELSEVPTSGLEASKMFHKIYNEEGSQKAIQFALKAEDQLSSKEYAIYEHHVNGPYEVLEKQWKDATPENFKQEPMYFHPDKQTWEYEPPKSIDHKPVVPNDDETAKILQSIQKALEKNIDPKLSPKEAYQRGFKEAHLKLKAAFEDIKNKFKGEATPTTPADYNTPAYRGIYAYDPDFKINPVQSFEKSYGQLYSTANPDLADMYAGGLSKHPGRDVPPGVFPQGAQVMPLLIDTRHYHYVDAGGKDWQAVHGNAIEEAKALKKKGVIVDNVHDEPESTRSLPTSKVFITLPSGASTVKSRFATKFDPADPNMLHVVPVLGVGGAAGWLSAQDNSPE